MNESITLTNQNVNLYVNGLNIMPVGSVICYAGSNAPSGWLLCNGNDINRSDYSTLFSIIGTTYGSNSGSTFKLPNLNQKFPMGKSGSNNLGDTGGSNTVTLTTNNLPAHTHTGTVNSAGSHSHTGTAVSDGLHSHNASDSGHTHTYIDTYFAENMSGGPNNIFGTSANTDYDNSYIIRPNTITNAGYSNIIVENNGAHTHSVTTNSDGAHQHTFTSDSTGSGNPFNITNPYIVLNYIIRY